LENFEMKKSLIALAVLAASGAAMAQSSVTLYGIADVWVGNVSVDDGTTDTSRTLMHSGGVSTSRWGMKGSEDLGGGLKANFQLESSINMDDGTTGSGFNRQAWVGFSGNFGDVRFGRVSSPFDNVQAASTALWDSDLSPVNNPGGGVFRTASGFIAKPTNTIYYKTPSFSGFGGEVSYSLDEDNEDGVFQPTEIAITSLSLTYAAGPFAAQFAYQEEERADVPTDDDFTFMRLGASYNFGMATAKATYGRAENATGTVSGATHTADAQTDEWQIGVDVPMSSALTLSAAYAESTDDAIGAIPEVKRSGFGLAAAYSLSKRTTLYGGVKTATEEQTGVHDIDTTVYAVGVKHTF